MGLENQHLTVEKISESLHNFQQDYSQRLTLLSKAYEKIYAVFAENGINPRFFNEMTCTIISDFHLIYNITKANFNLSIVIKLNIVKKTAPDCWCYFRVKNGVSKVFFEEKFNVFTLETALSKKFMLFFMNIFGNYCKFLEKIRPKVTFSPNGVKTDDVVPPETPIPQ